MITDHDISMAMAKIPSGSPVAKMLHQLLEMRRGVRLVVADHDFTKAYNSGMPWLSTFVMFEGGGCEWWNCRERAHTIRYQRSAHKPCLLCRVHADEGEEKDFWDSRYIHHERWKRDDEDKRAWDAKQKAKAEAEATP